MHKTDSVRRFLIVTALVLCAASPAFAWGELGHRTVAEIASRHLTDAAARAVPALLGDGLERLADVAGWADDYRDENPDTYPWHVVEIPLHGLGYDPARDCAKNDCIVEKIKDFSRVLANPEAPGETRGLALRFLAHFVGDIHMPFHALAPLNSPRGTWVRVGDNVDSLHLWWDNGFVDALGADAAAVADRLEEQFSIALPGEWHPGAPEDWANESFVLARAFVLDHDIPTAVRANAASSEAPLTLPDSVIDEVTPIVAWRLYLGGIRLARVLNAAFE